MEGSVELQLQEIEACSFGEVVCIVRCVAGIAEPGQKFVFGGGEGGGGSIRFELVGIERYGKEVSILDAPHAAKIHLKGAGGGDLAVGGILVSCAEL
ncbi:hypothetical protein [Streptomyces noursei]|uniref:hypothetical protein n=1 Tax=Streptomyces noursei TaxID=1971 RepID=UPI00045EF365|nr:hypothetical protein [Streptomyces noursei]AIA04908.1 hypothetical protein DC74_4428 [Streptomyces noursei]